MHMQNVLHVVPDEELYFLLYWGSMELVPFPQVRLRACTCVCVRLVRLGAPPTAAAGAGRGLSARRVEAEQRWCGKIEGRP